MTNEEWERKMEFILEQQAQFYANMELPKARMDRHDKGMDEFRKGMNELKDAQQLTEVRLSDLIVAQAQAARAQAHMNEVVAVMSDSQVRTDERLNTLISVFERHLEEGRNGNSKE